MTRHASHWFYRHFASATRTNTKLPRRNPYLHRPLLERLEDRTLLDTTWGQVAALFNPALPTLRGLTGSIADRGLGVDKLAQLPVIGQRLPEIFALGAKLAQPFLASVDSGLAWEQARQALIGLGFTVQYPTVPAEYGQPEPVTNDLLRVGYTRSWAGQSGTASINSISPLINYFQNDDNNGFITGTGTATAGNISLNTVFGVDLDQSQLKFFLRESTAASPTLAVTGVGGSITVTTTLPRINIAGLLNVQVAGIAALNLGGKLFLQDDIDTSNKLRLPQFTQLSQIVGGSITGDVTLAASMNTQLPILPPINWDGRWVGAVTTPNPRQQAAISMTSTDAALTPRVDVTGFLGNLARSFMTSSAGFNPLSPLTSQLNTRLPFINKSVGELLGIGNVPALRWLTNPPSVPGFGGDCDPVFTSVRNFFTTYNISLGFTSCADLITKIPRIIKGETLDLISFNTGVQRKEWSAGTSFGLHIPILPPVLSFSIGASFNASLFFQYQVGLGLDTTGFYIHPSTHIGVGGGVSASLYGGLAVFGFNVAKVEGGLGVAATARLGLYDPNPNDGKIYLDEIFTGGGLIQDFLRALHPTFSVDVTAYVKAVIDLWLFKFTVFQRNWSWPLVELDLAPPRPSQPTRRAVELNNFNRMLDTSLARRDPDGTLVIDGRGQDDSVILEQNGGNVKVNWVGLGKQTYANVSRVRFTGGAGADRLQVNPGFNLPITADGNEGDDYLEGGNGGNTLRGGLGKDSLLGGTGADSLVGGGDDDLLQGLGGNDRLEGDGGSDTLEGGAGRDLLRGGSEHDYLDGGADNDELYGDAGNDTLLGGEGLDTLDGGANDDLLLGGADNDTLLGNTGNDTLIGDNNDDTAALGGNDSLAGGAGDDVLVGEAGNDLLYGDDTVAGPSGNDSLFGGRGDDILRGGVGNDVLEGGDGADQMHGENGDDVLRGDAGNDELRGGFGNDTLNGGAGADRLFGGDDDDRLELDFATNDGLIVDELRGEQGTDRIVVVGRNDRIPDRPDVPPILRNLSEDDVIGFSQETIPGGFRYTATSYHPGSAVVLGTVKFFLPGDIATNDIEEVAIDGMKGNDRILVDPNVGKNLILIGGEGNDVLRGGKGRDVLYGGAGTDDLIGGEGDDELHGGLGGCTYTAQRNYCDQLDGGQGSDALYGGDGHDRLTGGDDSDALRGGLDVLHGGAGNDYMEAGPGRFDDLMYGDAGDDTLIGSDGRDVLSGDGHDTTQAAAGNDLLRGGGFYDVLLGGGGNDTIYGQGGADVVLGEGGNDLLYAEDVSGYLDQTPLNIGEVLVQLAQRLLDRAREFATIETRRNEAQRILDHPATTPEDRLRLQQQVNDLNNQLRTLADEATQIAQNIIELLRPYSGTTVDLVDGGMGNDTLHGSQYNDFLYGNEGDDSLIHSIGNDTVSGGPHNVGDTYVFEGTPGNDTLEMRAWPAPNNNYFVDFYLDGVLRATLLRRPDVEGLRVQAQGGHDTVKLGAGFGGVVVFPNVILDGGEGNDTLTGITSGNYTVLGGAGDDVYRMEGTSGNDRIELRTEQSLFSVFVGGTLQGRLRQLEAERIQVLGLDGNDTLSGAGLTGPAGGCALELSGGPDDDRLTGGPCEDTIYGGAGNDTLIGMNGADLLYGEGDDDQLEGSGDGFADVLFGGAGNDRLYVGSTREILDGGSGPDDRIVYDSRDRVRTVTVYARGFCNSTGSCHGLPAGSNAEGWELITDGNAAAIRYGTPQEDVNGFGFFPGRLYRDGRPLVTQTEFAVPTPSFNRIAIAAGADGNLWFTSYSSNKIGRITPSGQVTEFPLSMPQSSPVGITRGPDGNMWFAEANVNKIGQITPQGVIREFLLPTPNSFPTFLTFGPDGNLWFTEQDANKIGRMTPDGVFTEFALPPTLQTPNEVTLGPDDNLWFTAPGTNRIGRITPEGDIWWSESLSTPNSSPAGITTGPDGNLWFTEYNSNKIGRITPSGTITEYSTASPPLSGSIDITAGPDGQLWFTEINGNYIRRISTDGVITIMVATVTRPRGITLGPDGNIWYTHEAVDSKIGRITPGSPDWFQHTPYALSAPSAGVTTADFNNDGRPDLATVTNSNPGGRLNIWLNNGDGTFRSVAASPAIGNNAQRLAAADFDRDGKMDLVVAASSSNSLSVLWGNGDGTFQPVLTLPASTFPFGVVTGDFDGNGSPDIAAANRDANAITIHRYNGSRTFQAPTFVGVSPRPLALATGDFNRDGRQDLVATVYDGTTGASSNVHVLLNNGTGGFTVSPRYNVGEGPAWVTTGDLNRDGIADVVTANSVTSNISVRLTNSDGTLQAAINYGTGPGAGYVVLADITGDGKLDAVVANNFAGSGNGISVLPGDGLGSFGARFTHAMNRPLVIATGDFNRDGRDDLAVTGVSPNQLATLITLPPVPAVLPVASFRVTPNIPLSGIGTVTVAALDAFGNVVPGYRGTVHITSSDRAATLPADYTFTAADNGVKTFTVTLPTPGRHTLSVVDTANSALKGLGPEITEFSIPTAGSNVFAGNTAVLTRGSDGNVWFTHQAGLGRITPNGVVTEFPLPGRPQYITPGPDGNLWFTEFSSGKIGRINPFTGQIAEFALPNPGSQPHGITTGPDGNLWFAEFVTNKIGRITLAGVITEFVVPTAGSGPVGITAGADGNLWFTEFEDAGNRIGRITPGGVVTEFPIPTPNSRPYDITAGPDGNVWFTECSGDKIGKITPDGRFTEFALGAPGSCPLGIAVGPDGNLWFGERSGPHHVARIIPGGTITRFPVPTANSHPTTTIAGPDGIIWFTESTGKKIGRLAPGILVAAPPVLLGVTANLATLAAGSALAVTVTARDSAGRTNPGYRGTVRFTSNDAQAVLPANYTFRPEDNGVKKFNVILKTAGSRTVTVTDTVTSTITGNVSVTVQSALLGVATAPSAVGPNPRGVASGDFNRDGKQDLVTANEGSNTVSVLLGNGDGTFAAARHFAAGSVGAATNAVAVGDIDRDGFLDLITANPVHSQLVFLRGNGNGTFQAPRLIAGQDAVSHVIAADFTDDGKLDLVAPYTPGNHAGFYLGNGDGTFRLIIIPLLGNRPAFVAAGHFNADSFLDLMAVNERGNNVSVLLGNGNGTFQAPVFYPVGAAPTSATVADLNGDNRRDLIVANGSGNTVSVLRGNGNGTFQSPTSFPVGTYPTAVATTDLNGDSVPDLAVTHADGRLAMLLGTGTGAFGTPSFQQLDSPAYGLAVADFTGDGRPDVAVPRYVRNDVVMLRNVSLAALTAVPSTITPTAGGAFSVTVTARDAYGNVATGYRGNVCFSVSIPHADDRLPACYTFQPGDNGRKQFDDVVLARSGNRTITGNDTANRLTGAMPITVSPAAATRLTVSGFPTPITAGVEAAFTVTAFDRFDNLDTNYRREVRITSDDPQALFNPGLYTFTAADNGRHTFRATLRTAGIRRLIATDTQNGSVSGSQNEILVNVALHSGFRVSIPATVTAGQVFSATLTAIDAFGNTATGYAGTVRFSSPDDTFVVVPANASFAGSSGQITVAGFALRTPGTRTLRVADTVNGGLAGTAPVTVTPLTLIVNGTEAADTLVLREQAGNAAFFEVVLNDQVTASGPWVMLASVRLNALGGNDTLTVEQTRPGIPVLVSGGDGDDVFRLTTSAAGGPLTFQGGDGSDALYGPDAASTWNVTDFDGGTLRAGEAVASFSSVENLRGGAGADRFVFADGLGLSGVLDGGAGSNTLDYSAYTSNVRVILPLGLATGVAFDSPYALANIQNVTGGAGNDILVGDQFSNVLLGGPGRDVLIAGGIDWNTGEYSYLPDTLQGGDGDDILIGGYTLYDLDPDQLTALRDYWAGEDDYATRVANLTTGTGVPLLDASTVFSNYAGNTLLGEADLDLFFGIQDLDQHDWDELQGERFVGPIG